VYGRRALGVERRTALLRIGFALVFALSWCSPASAQAPIRVRVLSWNVWGVHTVSTHLEERMRAIPGAIADLDPDVVVLEELWEVEHGAIVIRELEARGYHTHHFQMTGDGKTGLFIASRFELAPDEFRPYSIGRTPHSLWHLDWMANKGAARWIATTPLGPIAIVGTHLQAQYVTDDYAAERLSQGVELALFIREEENYPLVVAGDFNSAAGELPRRTLVDLGELEDALPGDEPDTIYVRGGRTVAVRVVTVRNALTEPFPIGGGIETPLSDHPAVLLELELARRDPPPPLPASHEHAKKAAISGLRSASADTPWRVLAATAAAMTIVGLAFIWRRRVRRVRGTWVAAVIRLTGFSILAVLLAWTLYLGAYYYPARGAILSQIADRLAATP
jgi:endonuclease/exonuclease/phosphatase family metal-dependent hydrolase